MKKFDFRTNCTVRLTGTYRARISGRVTTPPPLNFAKLVTVQQSLCRERQRFVDQINWKSSPNLLTELI